MRPFKNRWRSITAVRVPHIVVALALAVTWQASWGQPQERVPADQPPDFVPLGVYLSWERPRACAQHFGVDRWVDVCRRLDVCAANHVDTLWVTNMAEPDLPRLIQECDGRGIRIIPSMSTIEGKIDWRWHKGGKYYEKVIPRVVKLAGDSKALAGWVLSDEPKREILPRMEQLRQWFRQADPNRFCLVVSMWPQTPYVPKETKLPVVCVDLYPFFGPKDPNGPHTDGASKHFFRTNAQRMIEAIGDRDVVPWIMPMCFSDVWGPRRYDDRGHMIALPGSYMHWRCPTLAEMRWQVWEALRSGCKGIVFYTLAPEAPDPKTETLPSPTIAERNPKIILAKQPTDMGPNALTNPNGSPTPQLEELGRAYALIKPHRELIRRWRRTSSPVATVQAPISSQCFVDPKTGHCYAVLVNDDLHRPRVAEVRFEAGATALRNIVHSEDIELAPDAAAGGSRGRLALAAGEGTILHVSREGVRAK